MKIAAVNGSPKGIKSNSNEILSIIKNYLPAETGWKSVSQIREQKNISGSELNQELYSCDVLLIAFPLYIDSIPASLMRFLEEYKKGYLLQKNRNQRVFAVCNCGFYEGIQNETALKIMEHFCISSGLVWCGGAGIGTGEMIREIKNVPAQAGIRRPLFTTLGVIAEAIVKPDGKLEKNIYTQHRLPWLFFRLAGEFGWRKQAKKNGLSRKNLFAMPFV